MDDLLNKWLIQKANFSSSLAAGILYPDDTRFIHFFSRSFANILKDPVWSKMETLARATSAQGLPTRHLRWVFQNAFVFGCIRPDGACLLVFTSRNVPPGDAQSLESLLADFFHPPAPGT